MAHFFIVAKMHIKKAPLREQWSLDGSFAVLLDGLVPWQDVVEVLWMPLDVGVRQVLEEVMPGTHPAGRRVSVSEARMTCPL